MKVTEAGQRFQISDSTGIGLRVEQQWRRKSAVAPKEELIAMSGALEATGGWASFEPPLPFGFEWKTLRRALLGWRHGQGEEEGGGREARTQRSRPSAGATQRMEANIAPTSGCGARRRRKHGEKTFRDHEEKTFRDHAKEELIATSGAFEARDDGDFVHPHDRTASSGRRCGGPLCRRSRAGGEGESYGGGAALPDLRLDGHRVESRATMEEKVRGRAKRGAHRNVGRTRSNGRVGEF